MVTSSSVSFLLGVLVSVIPNVLFRLLQQHVGSADAKQIVKRLYLGEVVKFGGLVALLMLSLQWPKLNAKMFLSAFVLTELLRLGSGWLRLLKVKNNV